MKPSPSLWVGTINRCLSSETIRLHILKHLRTVSWVIISEINSWEFFFFFFFFCNHASVFSFPDMENFISSTFTGNLFFENFLRTTTLHQSLCHGILLVLNIRIQMANLLRMIKLRLLLC